MFANDPMVWSVVMLFYTYNRRFAFIPKNLSAEVKSTMSMFLFYFFDRGEDGIRTAGGITC